MPSNESSATAETPSAQSAPSAPSAPSTDFFRAYLASWESDDVETVMGFFTDDIVFLDTTIDHGATGAKQMRRFVQSAFTNMAGTQLEYVSHVATAEGYAVEWVLRPAGIPGISVGTLRDGKISTNRDYWNGARFQIPNT